MGQNRPAVTVIILAATLIVCLAPFAGKAFHIDDPLFIWTAKQIQAHPTDFYGFTVNWYGTEMPMSDVTKNPPLASYYIAVTAFLFGWSETVLHLAFLLPALGVVLGSFFLARQLCLNPALATLTGMLTPVFLMSGTTVMCDIMMLCFWVWAVLLWIRGLERDEYFTLFIGALMIAVCALTKYFGVCLIPLLFVYSVAQKRGIGRWAILFLIPVAILAGYQWATHALYGQGLLLDVVSSIDNLSAKDDIGLILKGFIGLSFTGGCLATVFFFSPLLWSKRALAIGLILLALLVVPLSTTSIYSFSFRDINSIRWWLVFQLALFIVVGFSVLLLAIVDLYKRRDAGSLLLFLWLTGTFVFASFINWTMNGRSILPMAPALGILIARRVDQREGPFQLHWALPLIPAALLALFVTCGDYRLADTARRASDEIHRRYENLSGDIWFQGHWGFQYYMEAAGSKAIDLEQSTVAQGDIAIIPSSNTALYPMPADRLRLIHTFRFDSSGWLATMNQDAGAAFYASKWGGPFPFSAGSSPRKEYHVFLFKQETVFSEMVLKYTEGSN